MMKEARTGGAHLWHQDYGYWYQNTFKLEGCVIWSSMLFLSRYQNGNLAPDMGSVFMPVDKCTRENSCLQVGQHDGGDIYNIK